MKRWILALVATLGMAPAFAETVIDVSEYTSYIPVSEHWLILMGEEAPVAALYVPFCPVQQYSSFRFSDFSLSPGGNVVLDDKQCVVDTIVRITKP